MAASNFAASLKLVLKHEGGYANDPNDNGGETNYGITHATARAHGYRGSMRDIPMSTVHAIYKQSYWDALKCDNHPAGLDYCIFDYGVNSGVGRARKVLASLAPKHSNVGDLIVAICDERMAFLRRLSDWKHYGKGWSARVSGVRKAALAMVGKAPQKPVQPAPVPPPPDIEPPEDNAPAPKRMSLWEKITAWLAGGGVLPLAQLTDWKVAAVLVVGVLLLLGGMYLIRRRRK